MQKFFENNRIWITRLIGVFGLFILVMSNSYWEEKSEIFTYFLFMIGLFFVGVGSLGRMWCSLYIAGYKNRKLITEGPYSLVRNPLYVFSFIGALGVAFASETLTFPVLTAIGFFLYYPLVIQREERDLERLFGREFEEYKRRVPAVIPRLSSFYEPEEYTVNPRIYRRHMFSALWFIWIVGILELLEGLKELGVIHALWSLY